MTRKDRIDDYLKEARDEIISAERDESARALLRALTSVIQARKQLAKLPDPAELEPAQSESEATDDDGPTGRYELADDNSTLVDFEAPTGDETSEETGEEATADGGTATRSGQKDAEGFHRPSITHTSADERTKWPFWENDGTRKYVKPGNRYYQALYCVGYEQLQTDEPVRVETVESMVDDDIHRETVRGYLRTCAKAGTLRKTEPGTYEVTDDGARLLYENGRPTGTDAYTVPEKYELPTNE